MPDLLTAFVIAVYVIEKPVLFSLLARKRYYFGIGVLALLSLFQIAYLPVYYPQGVTVLDSWKYDFIWQAGPNGGHILWGDTAFSGVLMDLVFAVLIGIWSAVTRFVEARE